MIVVRIGQQHVNAISNRLPRTVRAFAFPRPGQERLIARSQTRTRPLPRRTPGRFVEAMPLTEDQLSKPADAARGRLEARQRSHIVRPAPGRAEWRRGWCNSVTRSSLLHRVARDSVLFGRVNSERRATGKSLTEHPVLRPRARKLHAGVDSCHPAVRCVVLNPAVRRATERS